MKRKMKVPWTNCAHTQPQAATLRGNAGAQAAISDKLRLGRTSTSGYGISTFFA
jgi:hypothetical protein